MRTSIPAVATLAAALTLTACGSGENAEAGAPAAGAVDSDATIDIAVGLEPTSLDITTTSGAAVQQLLLGNVYESLVGRTATGEIFPVLAEDWEVSPDRLTYTFAVREGLTFSDGSDLTAQDIASSLQAAAAEGSANPDAKRLEAVQSVAAPEEDTVVVQLARPDINLLDALTTGAGVVVPEGSTVDLANATNGSGPYRVSEWNTGSTITLDRVEDYWGEPAQNAEVVFHYLAEPTVAANALASGEVDLLVNATAESLAQFEGDEDYDVVLGDSTSWMTLGMNSAEGPLADPLVRQAIRQAVDKPGLIEVLGGRADQVGSMVARTDPWYEDLTDIDAYDPVAARAALAEAGYDDLALTLKVANTYDVRIAEYLAAQLAEVGVDLTIEQMEFATWLSDVYQDRDYELTMVLHVDPWTLTYYGNPDYYWNYDDAQAQQLVDEAMGAATIEERDVLLGELARVVAEDAASDWLYSPNTMLVAHESISGFPEDRVANRFPVSDITAQP